MLTDARQIISLAWPVLIGQLAIIAFGVTDTVMVGRYCATELAALGLGFSIYISVYVGLTGILVALQPITAQLFGAHRHAQIGEAVRQSAWLAIALALLGWLLLYFPAPLLRIADVPPALNERTLAYLRILSFGLPASLLFRIFSSLSNAVAQPRPVMTIQLGGLALKVPLNALLIHGAFGLPALGGAGAALASSIINWLSALAGIVLLLRVDFYRQFAVFAQYSWPHWRQQLALLKLGVPMGLSYLIEVTSYTFMALFIARFGTTTLAGHQITGNVSAVLYMTPLSIGIATSTLVAQRLGARELTAARTLSANGIKLAAGIALLYATVIIAMRPWLIAAYTPDPDVIAAAMPLVTIVAGYHLFDALQITTAFVLRAYRVAVVPTMIYAVALWGVGLGGGYIVGFDPLHWMPAALTGARGFWYANTLSLALAAAGLLVYWSSLSKRTHAQASLNPEAGHS
ncbi:MATE family efflux transporter [Mycetohabitans sp. B8]|uniref:MATE family efflux transporter n=1 Tax=Mycetohabitans sp. B8 TaxID=2841845 RepID=UPI001F42C066|nr:MATE family efflux transporter [Mycetohabitans sp. B8]MCG1042174.1 MATE family efflux transporter [Mycetohabitans sp. B8]